MIAAAHDMGVTSGFNKITGATGGGLFEGLSTELTTTSGIADHMPDMTGLSAASPIQAQPMSLLAMTGILNCGGGCGCGDDSKGEFKEMAAGLIKNVTRLNCTHVAVQTGKSRQIPGTAESKLSDKIKLSEQLHSLLKEIKSMRGTQDNSQTRHSVPKNNTADEFTLSGPQINNKNHLAANGIVKSTKIKEDNSQTRHQVPIKKKNKTRKTIHGKNGILRTRKTKLRKKNSNKAYQRQVKHFNGKSPIERRKTGGKATSLSSRKNN